MIKYDKDFDKVMDELKTNFNWINIHVYPDSYKNLLNDTIKAVKKIHPTEQLNAFAKMVANDDYAYLKDFETLLNDFKNIKNGKTVS